MGVCQPTYKDWAILFDVAPKEEMKNTDAIKDKIVDAYRRGVCDHNGDTLPLEKRGRNGKGCHFIGSAILINNALPDKIVPLWPRDANGILIED